MKQSSALPLSRAASTAWLICLSLLSFVLVTSVNRLAGAGFPGLRWLPDSCVASFLVCLLIYAAFRKSVQPDPAMPRSRPWGLALGWLAIWLLFSALIALHAGHWQRYRMADTPEQLVGFLLLGPLQEELLFRGAIFGLAERSGQRPVLWSTLFFSLHHFQLHGYRLTPAAVVQMGFTLPMGWVFGTLRARTGRLWPGWVVHVLTNLPGAFGG